MSNFSVQPTDSFKNLRLILGIFLDLQVALKVAFGKRTRCQGYIPNVLRFFTGCTTVYCYYYSLLLSTVLFTAIDQAKNG